MASRILIVEDDPIIGETVVEYFKDKGFIPILIQDGIEASHFLENQSELSLFILDIMLPGLSGLELLREIRESDAYCQSPVIMLTALGDESTQILSFNALADDYVTKPFSPKILVKRAQALLRREKAEVAKLTHLNITLDTDSYIVREGENEVLLTLREFEILRALLQNTNKVFTRESLLNQAWGYDYYGDERIVDVHIKNLRKKFTGNIIRTVKGVGYQMATETEDDYERN